MLIAALVLALATPLWSQEPGQAMQAAIAAQQDSIKRQVASVRIQIKAQPGAESGFFSLPPDAAGLPSTPAHECEPVPPSQIGPIVEKIARTEGLTPDLLRAVIYKESRYLPCAVSPKGAQGLMQLMPSTAADLGVLDPFDPEQNVKGGARFLKSLLGRYAGNLQLALGAYNAGAGAVEAYGGVPPYAETLGYIRDVLALLPPGAIAAQPPPSPAGTGPAPRAGMLR